MPLTPVPLLYHQPLLPHCPVGATTTTVTSSTTTQGPGATSMASSRAYAGSGSGPQQTTRVSELVEDADADVGDEEDDPDT